MFQYSLSSCTPDPLQHVAKNTSVCMTHVLDTSVCSHGSGGASDNLCSHPPLYHFLCVVKPSVVPTFCSVFPPVTGAAAGCAGIVAGEAVLGCSVPFTSFTMGNGRAWGLGKEMKSTSESCVEPGSLHILARWQPCGVEARY